MGTSITNKLFEPIQVGPIELENRIAVPPMNVALQDSRGYMSDDLLCYYAARARGGFGLIISDAIATNPVCCQTSPYFHNRLYEAHHAHGMRNMVDAVHAFGGRVIAQLFSGCGRQGGDPDGKVQSYAPSAIPYNVDPESLPKGMNDPAFWKWHGYEGHMPREITKTEIMELIESYYTSTAMAIRAGFDGVEFHACHGYLCHQFLSPNMNKRTDEWGGSWENRTRFVIEGFKQMMKAVKDFGVEDRFIVGCRTSAAEYTTGGLTMEDFADLHQTLIKLGSCYVNLSDGAGYEELGYFFPSEKDMPHKEKIAKFFTSKVSVPVIVPSITDPEFAARVATEADGTIIALGRQSIADPEWPNKVKDGRTGDIVKCIRCNTGCIMPYGLCGGVNGRCMVNPHMGFEKYQMENWPGPFKRGGKKYLK